MYCEYKRDPGMANLPWRVSVRLIALAKKTGMVVGIVLVVLLAVRVYLSQQGPDGRWINRYAYHGKTWGDIEQQGKPSKWVTLRACSVLRAAG